MAYNYRDLPEGADFADFTSVRLGVATREDILSWSYGEVLKPETINYRTQKPEKDGLFCERIFGPVKDINPHDTRFKGARGRNIAVDKKGAIVTKAIVRRERMGHIELAVPIVHIWFLRVAPSPLSYITGLTIKNLERVIYFATYLILEVNEDLKAQMVTEITKAYEAGRKLLVEKPLDVAAFSAKLFDKLVAESKKDKLPFWFDVWETLIELDEGYAAGKETMAELAKHGLLDFTQAAKASDALAELAKVFKGCSEIHKHKNVAGLYRQFNGGEVDKEAPKLETALKADFRKIKKGFDALEEQLVVSADIFNEIYAFRKQKLTEALIRHGLISETDYRNLPDAHRKIVKVGMGGEAVHEMLQGMELDQLINELRVLIGESKGQKQFLYLKRLKVLEGMKQAGVVIKDFCLTILPVIPPNLRPIIQLSGGRFATSDLNDLYRRVINRNNRLKKLQELKAPEVICRNEKRMLQEAVDALIDNSQQRSARVATTGSQQRKLKSLADILKRKQGRLRQNLLGKRVDYSGRSVIVVGPDLHISECGLPKIMALELFKPFVIGYLINHDYASNMRSAARLIETGENIVWDALDQVIQGKLVLLNRAPSLHRLSVQAFRPKLIEGKAIQLHPLVCKGYNADFDGDQMAVHLPLSDAAQAEAAELMVPARNLLHPADGMPILYFDQDIVMGLYYLTYVKGDEADAKGRFASMAEAVFAYDRGLIELQTPIELIFRGERQQTTFGRAIFNETLPADFPYQNCALGKDTIKKVMADVYNAYDNETTAQIADDLKDLAFKYATKSGFSIGMGDFFDAKGAEELKAEGIEKAVAVRQQYENGLITNAERYRLTVQNWFTVNERIQQLVDEQFAGHESAFTMIVNSKARGSVNLGTVKRMCVSFGVMNDSLGRALELSINGNLFDGLPTLEYFVGARGARKGLIDVALSTADSGHLTRRLVYVAQDVITVKDGTEESDPGFEILRTDAEEMGSSMARRLVNRYAAEDIRLAGETLVKAGEPIGKEAAEQVEASELDSVRILSILSAPAVEGVPTKSYGIDLANGQLVEANHPVGVIAAQSIGEPSTQLKLDSKHGGGMAVASQALVNTGLPRVEELFEARNPKGIGYLAPFAGVAEIKELSFDCEIILRANEDAVMEIGVEGCDIGVKLDQTVNEGELLAVTPGKEAVTAPFGGLVEKIKDKVLYLKAVKALEARFLVPKAQKLLVENGQLVERGAQLNEGSLKLDDLLQLRGLVAAQRYILIEISKVFSLQGSHVADKHLEVIIRQMFSRLRVVASGDSRFIDGDVVSKRSLLLENQALLSAGKTPAVWAQCVLGITKINSTSDSFLVAASFQDTTRILVSSAINGRVDHLSGLIENVILGRKIPVGTGVLADNPIDENFKDI
ncbi:DNA-directed RNA polymerase subunit beta' [Candidatus Saccharibacteria bacterium]|nr:DNA-directed RNA polymerase subunit beta' [Candidatus Saccharibacteria bacterium]